MATIPGVRVTDSIVPTDTADTFPTHSAEYGKGGHRSVADVAARDAIPADRREEGMTVYVQSNQTRYTLIGGVGNGDWQTASVGVSEADRVFGGRLTAGVGPYSESGGSTVLQYLPAEHDEVSLYDVGLGEWLKYKIPSGGVTRTLEPMATDPSYGDLVADENYDVYLFVEDTGTTLGLWLEPWSTDTLRNVSPVRLDGTRVHGDDSSFLFLGTIRTWDDGGTIKIADDDQRRFVWNEYNRVVRRGHVRDTTASWSELSASWVAVNGGDTRWLFEFVHGGETAKQTAKYEAMVEHRLRGTSSDPVEPNTSELGVGYDSTTVLDTEATVAVGPEIGLPGAASTSDAGFQLHAVCNRVVGPGYHFMNAIARRVIGGGGEFRGDRNQAAHHTEWMA